jgi:hypothetical protein
MILFRPLSPFFISVLAMANPVPVGPAWDPAPLRTSQDILGTAQPNQADPLVAVASPGTDETILSLAPGKDRDTIPLGELFFLDEGATSAIVPSAFHIPRGIVQMILAWAE